MIKKMVNIMPGLSDGKLSEEEKKLIKKLDPSKIPSHVAIIMDGNGRWARRRGLPRAYGHRAGIESLREVVRIGSDIGLKYLTVYAFSTENWKRPQEEVNTLMDLLVEYLAKELDELCAKNVKINIIGKKEGLPEKACEAIAAAQERSRNCTGLNLNIALNYGGRTEIVDAVGAICAKVARNEILPENIDQDLISQHLYTAGQPDPDLLIRPSGDFRVSNFLLWQMAYTEFWHTDVMWPDFKGVHLLQALVDYQRRNRRFGGI